MYHPGWKKEGCFGSCRYVQRRTKKSKAQGKFKRTDFTAKCNICGWEGVIL